MNSVMLIICRVIPMPYTFISTVVGKIFNKILTNGVTVIFLDTLLIKLQYMLL